MKIADIRKWHPCSTATELIKTYANRELNPIEILTTPILKGKDDWRLWVVLREEVIDAKTLRLFACACAELALKRRKNTDKCSWSAIKTARLYAKGKATNIELNAAYADAVSHADATIAAGAATYAAYPSAANAANYAVAYATDAANYNTEKEWQCKHLLKILKRGINPAKFLKGEKWQ